MGPIYVLNDDPEPEAIKGELTALIDEATVMTDLLVNFDEWTQPRLISFACALDRRMIEISKLSSLLDN